MGLVVVAALLPSVVHADCQQATKDKLATIDASQNDRDLLCASMAIAGAQAQASFTIRDYKNLISSAQRLRANGYSSQTMYAELVVIAGLRSSEDVQVVVAAHRSSTGCLTPALVAADMANAFKSDPPTAREMYRGWNRDGWTNYLVIVGHANSCTFKPT